MSTLGTSTLPQSWSQGEKDDTFTHTTRSLEGRWDRDTGRLTVEDVVTADGKEVSVSRLDTNCQSVESVNEELLALSPGDDLVGLAVIDTDVDGLHDVVCTTREEANLLEGALDDVRDLIEHAYGSTLDDSEATLGSSADEIDDDDIDALEIHIIAVPNHEIREQA